MVTVWEDSVHDYKYCTAFPTHNYFLQVVTSSATKTRILEACHNDKVGGCHFGRDRTIDKVSARFYWNGIVKDVTDWVS